MTRVSTNRAATAGERFSHPKADRFLTVAALKKDFPNTLWATVEIQSNVVDPGLIGRLPVGTAVKRKLWPPIFSVEPSA